MKQNDPFFVGYLPFPAALRAWFFILIPLLIAIALGTAVLLSSEQKSDGEGTWDVSNAVSITGRLSLNPYPIIHTDAGESVLVVVQGKQDPAEVVAPFAGKMVTATGFDIRRGGWHMIEIPSTGAVVIAENVQSVSIPKLESLGLDSLKGEIVDSKCFLGVMKPGGGKVHRSCAALCLLGGIPPMMVVNTASGKYGYLIINADGSSASRQLAGRVAIPVKLAGEFERRGDLIYVRLANDHRSIVPLSGTELVSFGETLAVDAAEPSFCGVLPNDAQIES